MMERNVFCGTYSVIAMQHPRAQSRCIAYNGGQWLVSGGADRLVRVWDVQTGACVRTVLGHAGSVRAVVCADGFIMSGGYDTGIR